jgi:hypothetical protein
VQDNEDWCYDYCSAMQWSDTTKGVLICSLDSKWKITFKFISESEKWETLIHCLPLPMTIVGKC